jgi:RimJ/RimL family protein N-acetyltransferase
MTPTLASPDGAVRLSPFAERHLTARYVAWLNDPVATRHSEQRHRRHDLDSCRDFLRRISAGGFFWAIEIPAAGGADHVGNVAAYVDAANQCADLTILLGEESARGKGIGKAAWAAALDWLLSAEGGMRLVTAGTMAVNASMLGTMRACGMRECGRVPGRFLLDGESVDLVIAAKAAERNPR